MKLRLSNLALMLGAVLLSGCGGDLAGGSDNLDPLQPIVEDTVTTDGPRPPENAKVITADGSRLLDVAGNSILLRGVNLDYANKPDTRVDSIASISDLGSNIVRIIVSESTTADELQAALDQAMLNNMVAMVSLDSPEKLSCNDDDSFFFEAVNTLWLDRWLPVLAAAEYQGHLMINIANEWGPMNVWNAASIGYDEYIDDYKTVIRRFRSAGFKVPLVIDAANCGEDFNTFLGSRGRELQAADEAKNLVLSVHAFGQRWQSRSSASLAMNKLALEGLPVIVSEFGDSRASTVPIDHMNLIEEALGGEAVIFRFPWESTEDKAGYAYSFDSAVDFLEGGAIVFDIYIDSAYKIDGNLAYQAFLVDSSGRYASLGFNTVSGFQANTWNTINLVVDEAAEFGSIADDFDFSSVAQVGFEVAANGKPIDVNGEIRFDNLIVGVNTTSGSSSNALYEATFEVDEGWIKTYGAGDGTTVSQVDDTLNIQAPWTSTDDAVTGSSQAVKCDAAALTGIDLQAPLRVSVDIFVPAEYKTSGGNIQFVFNDANNGFAGFKSTGLSAFVADSWNTFTVDINDFSDDAGYISTGFDTAATPSCVGLQLGSIASSKATAFQVDNFRILTPPEPAERQTVYEATFEFSENWKRSFGAGDASSVYQFEEALAVFPAWGEERNNIIVSFEGTSTISPKIDLQKPMTLSMDVFIPQEYETENSMYVEFTITDQSYQNTATFGYTGTSKLKFGEWNSITKNITNVIADAGYIQNPDTFILDEIPQTIGLQVANINAAKTQPILIDNYKLVLETGIVLPDNLVINLDFDDQAQVDAMALSYVRGPVWMESSLIDAKQKGVGVDSFGWIAWSWFGDSDDDGVFNLSTSEDTATSLTDRGEELINGANGIANTASTVIFE